jgi:hypothetical protein
LAYVICVFNTPFGKTENLLFDLRFRCMGFYSATSEEENKADDPSPMRCVRSKTHLKPRKTRYAFIAVANRRE